MALTTYAQNLADGFVKSRYSDIIVAEHMIDDVPLLKALKANIDRSITPDTNGNLKLLIQTRIARNARGLPDGSSLQTSDHARFAEMTVGIKRILATCGLTELQALALNGGGNSWGPMMRRTLDDTITDFKNAQNFAAHSNGSGALALVASATYTGGATTFGNCTGAVITCNNTYRNSNIENTSAIQPGMWVSIWNASTNTFYTDGATVYEWRVASVAPGKRTGDGSGDWAAVTGTVTLEGITTGFTVEALAAGDIIVLAGTPTDLDGGSVITSTLPMGMTGIIANGAGGSYPDSLTTAPWQTTTFQGVTRTTYASLMSDIWQRDDFTTGSAGTATESWDLSVISDAMDEVVNKGGRTKMIRCHPEMSRTLYRLNKSGNSINVVVNSTGEVDQTVVGDRRPKFMLDVEGELLPIVADRWCPRYVVEGLDTSVIRWVPIDNANWREDSGKIWGPTRGGRATTVEAGYQWWYELLSERCDWHFRVQDLAPV